VFIRAASRARRDPERGAGAPAIPADAFHENSILMECK
jgi:hypothetical protein